MGIGRNQYIELMNQHRSSRKLFRKRPASRDLLPNKPADINIEPWFLVQPGCILEDDIATIKQEERLLIDSIVDNAPAGPQAAGTFDYACVHSLYRKGTI